MTEQELNQLLQKQADGTLTPEEKARLDRWYHSFDETRKNIEVFRDELHEREVYKRLLALIHEKADVPANKRKPARWLFFRIIAAACILGVVSYGLYNYRDIIGIMKTEGALMITRTESGKIMKVTLADGTLIWLDSNSELKYPGTFNGNTREVYLTGEAFFQVTHNPQKPFIVHAGEVSTRVLGTSFNINAYPQLHSIKVNVATGKVSVAVSGKVLATLTVNKQVEYNKITGTAHTSSYQADYANSWKDGLIRLDGAAFDELALLIKNIYGFQLETGNKNIKDVKFTLTFNRTDKIENLMKVVCRISNTRYRLHGHTISIY